MTTHRTLQCSSCEYILHCIGTCRYSRKLIKYQHTKYKFLTDKLGKKNNSDLDKCQDTKQEGVQGHSWSCPVRISGPDVPLWAGGVCVCVLTKRRKKRAWKRKTDTYTDRQCEEWGMCCLPNHSARLWFIWHLLDGGLGTTGHLHRGMTSDLLHLLKSTQLSLLNPHPDRRDELGARKHTDVQTHELRFRI